MCTLAYKYLIDEEMYKQKSESDIICAFNMICGLYYIPLNCCSYLIT